MEIRFGYYEDFIKERSWCPANLFNAFCMLHHAGFMAVYLSIMNCQEISI